MNQKDRERLDKMRQLLEEIPAGHTGKGRQTRSLIGVNRAHDDFMEGRVFVRLMVNAMIETSVGFEDAGDPDRVLFAFTQWIAERKRNNWGIRIPDFYQMMIQFGRE